VLNFTNLDQSTTSSSVQTHRDEVPTVQERVTVTQLAQSAFVTTPEPPIAPALTGIPEFHVPALGSSLGWEKLRDYVIEKILDVHGPFPRDNRRENTIFMGFYGRWEDLSLPIARHAFEVTGGDWLGAPVSVARFEKSSDIVFAQRIAGLL
jgi:hypothetical protein